MYLFFGLTTRHAGSLFPDQGWNLCPIKWKHGVLTTVPPGKSRTEFFLFKKYSREYYIVCFAKKDREGNFEHLILYNRFPKFLC